MSDTAPVPQINELIEQQDNVELIRDQVAAILSLELQNQYALAVEKKVPRSIDYKASVYVENGRPYDNPNATELLAFVNVLLPKVTVPAGNSRIGNQKEQATFFIDCAACGNDTGDFRDEKSASIKAWKLMRLVRRIIMSDPYAYLGLRGTVGSRIIITMEQGGPPNQEASALAYVVIRATLEVQFMERALIAPTVPLETIHFTVEPWSGEVLANRSEED